MIWAGCRLEGRSGHEAAWELLRMLYRQQTGEDLPQVKRTETGYPYFPDSPWYFSLTHTRRHAFCVLSRNRVGIDAEELDRRIQAQVANRVLSRREKAQYDAAPDKNRAMLTFWVLKEAEAKCRGTGLTGMPNGTNFLLDDARVTQQDGCLIAIVEEIQNAV